MDDSLGDLLRRRRRMSGWTQRDLARELGCVGQQAVSRWERGLARPEAPALRALAVLLDLPEHEVRAAAEREPTATASSTAVQAQDSAKTPLPVRPRAMTLPFGGLEPRQFEFFSRDLLQMIEPAAEVNLWGGSGHGQAGWDVVARHPGGRRTGVQCKREQRFGPERVRAAVAAVSLPVEECLLFLARTASPQAREEIAQHGDWRLWDADDLSAKVRTLRAADALRLVETYFPDLIEAFLGISRPSPWLPARTAFPTGRGRTFTHEHPLVGRRREVEQISELVGAEISGPVLLVGHGGQGKSRLLRALAEEPGAATVCFLEPGYDPRPEDYKLLPQTERLIVGIDDAHDRKDVRAVLAGIERHDPQALVVLATRPYGLPALRQALYSTGRLSSDIPRIDIQDLTEEEALDLVHHVGGTDLHPGIAHQLATAGRDCALVIVVGSALASSGRLSADRVVGVEQVRAAVLEAFAGSSAGSGDGSDETVLGAVAALQPLRSDDPRFQRAMRVLTNHDGDELELRLLRLQERGILLRRHTSLRIVPDLLGDVLLSRAALDSHTGRPRAFLDRLRSLDDPVVLEHVLINTARVDWQAGAASRAASLSEHLWNGLERDFREAKAFQRTEILGIAAKAAPFLPHRALALARLAHDSVQDGAEGDEEIGWAPWSRRWTDVDVARAIPPVLAGVGYDLNHLADAADLLWDLARQDDRAPHNHADHAMRVLHDFAEFGMTKPLAYNRTLFDRAVSWVEEERLNGSGSLTVFDVLSPLLATEGSKATFDRGALRIQPFSIGGPGVRALRARVVDLALHEARCGDLRRAVAAIKAIGEALVHRSPVGAPAGSAQDADLWTEEFVATLNQLRDLVAGSDLDPVVGVAVRQAVRWHARSSTTETKRAAAAVIDAISQTSEHRLARALRDDWMDWSNADGHFDEAEQAHEQWRRALAVELVERWGPDGVVHVLIERLRADHRGFGDSGASTAGQFLWSLVSLSPAVGEVMLSRLRRGVAPEAEGVSVLSGLMDVVLSCLAQAGAAGIVRHARELMAQCAGAAEEDRGRRALVLSVASAFGHGRGSRRYLVDEEAAFLRELVRHADPRVRALVVRGVRVIGGEDRATALGLLGDVVFEDSAEVAEEVFLAVGTHGFVSWQEVPPTLRQRLLTDLVRCPSLDEYGIMEALRGLSSLHPDDVLDLLIARVDHQVEAGRSTDYTALPYRWPEQLAFRRTPSFRNVLRRTREWVAADLLRRSADAADLFNAVSAGFDAEVLEVLEEGLQVGSSDQVTAVAALLRAVPRRVLWDHPDFVERALAAASCYGEVCRRAMTGALHACAVTGTLTGTIGGPFEQDVERRDRSRSVLQHLRPSSPAASFYRSVLEHAERAIKEEVAEDARFLDHRTW